MKILGINDQVLGILFVILSSLATIIYTISLKSVDTRIKLIIIFGFIVRVVLAIIDVYVARLPEAGFDDDSFYKASVNIYENGYSNISQDIYGGAFSKGLAIVYFFIGSSRIAAQYLNVLFFAITAILFTRALTNFKVSKRAAMVCILLVCLLPNAILINSILRRETIIELCTCASIFFLSKWYQNKRLTYAVQAVLLTVVASLFHTTFIFGALVLSLYFLLFDKKKGRVSFSIASTSKAILISTLLIVAGTWFLSMFNNKFSTVDSMDDIYTAANRSRGGSVYLENYQVHNFGELILFAPLKLFYFLFSPVPWKFRNAMDVVSFIFDALIYAVLVFIITKNHKNTISRLMLGMFIALSAVFALGTFNSGTAIRHRFSLLPFLLVSYSMTSSGQSSVAKIKSTHAKEKK